MNLKVKRILKVLLLLIIICFLKTGNPRYTFAADYFVSTTGSDTNLGEISTPWKTLQKAANTATAGDTIYIRGGTYNERVVINHSGNTDGYITFTNYNQETPIIDGTGIALYTDGLIKIYQHSYIKVINLTFINAPGPAVYVHSSNHIQILNCHTRNSLSSGIGIWSSDSVLVDGNTVVNARNAANGYEESISIARTTNFEVSNNDVSMDGVTTYLGNEGIDVKESSRNGRVHHNLIHDYGSAGGALYIDAWAAGLNGSQSLSDIDVYANKVSNAGAIVVGSERGGTVENVNIFNNIVINSVAGGVIIADTGSGPHGPRININIFNNTIYKFKNNGSGGIYLTSEYMTNIVVKNNLVYVNNHNNGIAASSVSLLSQIKADHNMVYHDQGYYGAIMCSLEYPSCVELSEYIDPNYPDINNNYRADPKFIDISLYDVQLLPDSPAIDKGTDLTGMGVVIDHIDTTRPQGAFFDIGAYEYRVSIPSPSSSDTPSPADIDGNGQVFVEDLILILQNWLGSGKCFVFNCDVNNNSKINAWDAAIIIANWGSQL